jgi:hypothetical protein
MTNLFESTHGGLQDANKTPASPVQLHNTSLLVSKVPTLVEYISKCYRARIGFAGPDIDLVLHTQRLFDAVQLILERRKLSGCIAILACKGFVHILALLQSFKKLGDGKPKTHIVDAVYAAKLMGKNSRAQRPIRVLGSGFRLGLRYGATSDEAIFSKSTFGAK